MNEREITPQSATAFLREAANYFERRDAKGEDAALWANVYNAENCRKIASLIERLANAPSDRGTDA